MMSIANIQTGDSSILCSGMDIGKGGCVLGGKRLGSRCEMRDIVAMQGHCKHGLMMPRTMLEELIAGIWTQFLVKVPKQFQKNARGWGQDLEMFHGVLIIQEEPSNQIWDCSMA